MIIRKPYAFLIKHFKIIHLALFAFITYIAYKSSNLYGFFNDYVKEGFYAYTESLTGTYINLYMFLAIGLIILSGVTIYILLKWKDKKRTLYVFLCSFYLILFVVFIIYFGVLSSIENTVMDTRTVRVYRDILLIVNMPQYIFMVVSLIRGVGFDIKKFNFRKDLEELQIEAPDEEEVEITFGKNVYKYKRKARRIYREFKYYALENKFFFGVIVSLVVVSAGLAIYLNFEVYNKDYKETELFTIDGVSFNVVYSYASNVDYKGDAIIPGKDYVAVLLHIKNNSDERKVLETEDLRLVTNKTSYTPVFSKNNHFIDLGEGFANQTLYPGEEYDYLLVFEIPSEEVKKSYTFRMINSVNYLKGELNANHKDVNIKPTYFEGGRISEEYSLGDIIDLGKGTLYGSEVLVMSYDIKDSYTIDYNYCVSGNCFDAKKVIKPTNVGTITKTVMRLEVDFDVNEDVYIYKYLKDNSNLINMFGKLRYTVDGVSKSVSLPVYDYEFLNEREVYVEVPYEVKSASEVSLDITVRHAKFSIKLK